MCRRMWQRHYASTCPTVGQFEASLNKRKWPGCYFVSFPTCWRHTEQGVFWPSGWLTADVRASVPIHVPPARLLVSFGCLSGRTQVCQSMASGTPRRTPQRCAPARPIYKVNIIMEAPLVFGYNYSYVLRLNEQPLKVQVAFLLLANDPIYRAAFRSAEDDMNMT